MSLIIFTSLDNLLLPAEELDYGAIASVVKDLQRQNIPLIFVTSHTRPEAAFLAQNIGLSSPFVVEQGSSIYIPQGDQRWNIAEADLQSGYYLHQLGCSYTQARAALKAVQEEISKILRGFGDLDEDNVQSLMNTSAIAAKQAKAREFSEYFVTPSRREITELQTIAGAYGFKILAGEQLSLITGANADPARAIAWLKQNYQSALAGEVVTVGLGTAGTAKDLPLLEAVDQPIVIPVRNQEQQSLTNPSFQQASKPGLEGWLESIAQVCRHQF